MRVPEDRRIPFLDRTAALFAGSLHPSAKAVPMDYSSRLCAIAELPEFIRAADKLLDDSELLELIGCLALNPRIGDLLEGTGGIRKLRWRRGSRGKSGGVRVIYYFHDDSMPLYLLTMFAKGDRANLSRSERNALAALVHALLTMWKERSG